MNKSTKNSMEIELAYTKSRNTYGQLVIKINLAETLKLFSFERISQSDL